MDFPQFPLPPIDHEVHRFEGEGGALPREPEDPKAAEDGQHLERAAVRMPPGSAPGFFPAHDPRAGYYDPARIYRVPEDLDEAKANALVAGGFAWCDRPKGD